MNYLEVSMDARNIPGHKIADYGTKRVIITQPSKKTTHIIQSAFPVKIKEDLHHVDSQLRHANNKLRSTLPFVFSDSYEAHQKLLSSQRYENILRHFESSQNPRTLEELSELKEMECSEHALAIQQIRLPDWHLYRFVSSNGIPARHIILAKQLGDLPYMMIVDPTARASSVGLNTYSYLLSKARFEKKYKLETILQE